MLISEERGGAPGQEGALVGEEGLGLDAHGRAARERALARLGRLRAAVEVPVQQALALLVRAKSCAAPRLACGCAGATANPSPARRTQARPAPALLAARAACRADPQSARCTRARRAPSGGPAAARAPCGHGSLQCRGSHAPNAQGCVPGARAPVWARCWTLARLQAPPSHPCVWSSNTVSAAVSSACHAGRQAGRPLCAGRCRPWQRGAAHPRRPAAAAAAAWARRPAAGGAAHPRRCRCAAAAWAAAPRPPQSRWTRPRCSLAPAVAGACALAHAPSNPGPLAGPAQAAAGSHALRPQSWLRANPGGTDSSARGRRKQRTPGTTDKRTECTAAARAGSPAQARSRAGACALPRLRRQRRQAAFGARPRAGRPGRLGPAACGRGGGAGRARGRRGRRGLQHGRPHRLIVHPVRHRLHQVWQQRGRAVDELAELVHLRAARGRSHARARGCSDGRHPRTAKDKSSDATASCPHARSGSPACAAHASCAALSAGPDATQQNSSRRAQPQQASTQPRRRSVPPSTARALTPS